MLTFGVIVVAQIVFHHTVYRYDSLTALSLYIAYGFLMFTVVQTFGSAETKYFGNILALLVPLYSLFAVLQSVTSSGGAIYWRATLGTNTSFGSYVNHNHYAGLIELLLPFGLVIIFTSGRPGGVLVLQIFGAIMMAASVFLIEVTRRHDCGVRRNHILCHHLDAIFLREKSASRSDDIRRNHGGDFGMDRA